MLEFSRIVPLYSDKYVFEEIIDARYIKKSKNNIYIPDFEYGKIIILDNNGHFIDSIFLLKDIKLGKVNIIDYDVFDEEICVICIVGHNYTPIICRYSNERKYIGKFELDDVYYNVKILSNNKVLLYSADNNDSGYNYAIYDLKTKKKEAKWDSSNNEYCVHFQTPFNQVNSELLITKSFDNTIYTFTGNGMQPKINLLYQYTNKPPVINGACAKFREIRERNLVNIVSEISSISESANNLYLVTFITSGRYSKSYLTSIDKTTNKTKTAELESDGSFSFADIKYLSLKNGYGIASADMEKLKEYIRKQKLQNVYKDIMNSNANMAIVEFKLR